MKSIIGSSESMVIHCGDINLFCFYGRRGALLIHEAYEGANMISIRMTQNPGLNSAAMLPDDFQDLLPVSPGSPVYDYKVSDGVGQSIKGESAAGVVAVLRDRPGTEFHMNGKYHSLNLGILYLKGTVCVRAALSLFEFRF